MNIFYIHNDPVLSAQELADQHVLKMGIESAQMLSTAHWLTGSTAPYRKSHANHPSSIWARQSIQHYRWLAQHGLEILREYTRRYGKTHKTETVINWLITNEPNIPDNGFMDPPQCMPDEFKHNSTIQAYRNFYIKDKLAIKKLTYNKNRSTPYWAFQ